MEAEREHARLLEMRLRSQADAVATILRTLPPCPAGTERKPELYGTEFRSQAALSLADPGADSAEASGSAAGLGALALVLQRARNARGEADRSRSLSERVSWP